MSHVRNRDIAAMSQEALASRLLELQEELLQLQAEKALGGTPSNMGAYKATRRSIARIKSYLHGATN
jgi:ribosomal protein L29